MSRAALLDGGFVASKRRIGASWSAIAGMTGVAETDLRRHFEAGFLDPTPRRALSPREAMEALLTNSGLIADHAVVIARLWQANGARIDNDTLARGVLGGSAAAPLVTAATRAAEARLGLVFRRLGNGRGVAMDPASVAGLTALRDQT